jgi:uncharacterized membrane protein
VLSRESGYYQGFDEKQLLKFAEKHELQLQMLHPIGTYVLKGTPLLIINRDLEEQDFNKMLLDIDFYFGQEIDKNAYYGFLHLTEVAVKALSPGINDPGTAVLSINSLTDLFARIMNKPIEDAFKNAKGKTVIITKQIPFGEFFNCVVLPIWNYGKKDMNVQNAFIRMLNQLMLVDKGNEHNETFERLLKEVKSEAGK